MIEIKTVKTSKLTEMKLDISDEELEKISKQFADTMIKQIEYSLFMWPYKKPELISDYLKTNLYQIPVKPVKFEVTSRYGPTIK